VHLARLLALGSLREHSVFAISPFPVASTACETCSNAVWRTDVAGISHVDYGTTADYGSRTARDSTLVLYREHITASPGTILNSQAASADGLNNSVNSKDIAVSALSSEHSGLFLEEYPINEAPTSFFAGSV